MKKFIVAVMAIAMIMTSSIAFANGYIDMEIEGDMIQSTTTGIATENIDLVGYNTSLGAGSVAIASGQVMSLYGSGTTGSNNYEDASITKNIDQTLNTTYNDSNITATQDASITISTIDNYNYNYGTVNVDGFMMQGAVTEIAVDSLVIGPLSLGAGSVDTAAIQVMGTSSSSYGSGIDTSSNFAQSLTTTTPNSIVIMNQNASCSSTSTLYER